MQVSRMVLKWVLKFVPTNIDSEKHDKIKISKIITIAMGASEEQEHAHAVIEYTTQFDNNSHVIWLPLLGPTLQQYVM